MRVVLDGEAQKCQNGVGSALTLDLDLVSQSAEVTTFQLAISRTFLNRESKCLFSVLRSAHKWLQLDLAQESCAFDRPRSVSP